MNAFPLQPIPLSITKGEGESGSHRNFTAAAHDDVVYFYSSGR